MGRSCYPLVMTRKIPAAGINLFQLIYVLIREYTERSGLPPLNLSLGNPDGVPAEEIRKLKAQYAADPGYDYHTYAEDKDLLGFAEGMVELHGGIRPGEHPSLKAVPIAGIKTASALIPLACALQSRRDEFRVASHLPAYDVIGTWSAGYLGAQRIVWPLSCEDDMRLNVGRLRQAVKDAKAPRVDLVFVIRPGNPAAVGASKQEWEELIAFCLESGARLVNDGAYAGLADEGSHIPLAVVAKDYPDLEWIELYSVSKSFNDPGARLGALVGSRDFVEDYLMIKGNTDSGPVPSIMAAYGRFFADRSSARAALSELRALYRRRLDYLVPRLSAAGLRPACRTDAGFFTLWKTPASVLGVNIDQHAAKNGQPLHEAFNRLVISETGIVGVHFQGEGGSPLIRYAVCTDVLSPAFQKRFEEQLARLKPVY
jgi:LL-diaminopimelate aminotransferase/alanine-synthesizing transaminase